MPERTSGAGVRRSCATNAARIAAAPASEPSVRAEAQPASGASTTREDEEQHPGGHGDRAGQVEAAGPARRVAGVGNEADRGQERDQRQRAPGGGTPSASRVSVSSPPNTSPSENPVAPVAV